MNKTNEMIDKIIDISCVTDKENSLLYNFDLKDNKVKCNVGLVTREGTKTTFIDETIEVEQKFYNFVVPLIKKFNESSGVVFSNIVDIDGDNLLTYRLLTKDNDMMTFDGLTYEDAAYLKDVIEELDIKTNDSDKVFSLVNNQGKVSPILVILIMLILSCLIVGCVLFL